MMYRLPPVAGEWIDRSQRARVRIRRTRVQGIRWRHHFQCAGSRGRDDAGPQLQIPPAARHLLVREPRRQQPVPGRRDVPNVRGDVTPLAAGHARARGEHDRRSRARSRALRRMAGSVSARGLLLQGIPRQPLSRAGSSEFAPCRASGASTPTRAACARRSDMPSATCWSLARAPADSRPRCRPPMPAHACCWWTRTRARAVAAAGAAPRRARLKRSSIAWPQRRASSCC